MLTSAQPEKSVLRVQALRAVHRGRHGDVVAAEDVSFELHVGKCAALVGESGSGKTTIARCVAGLHPPERGTIALHGALLDPIVRRRTREQRRGIQMVFQNPAEALNPRQLVADQVARPAQLLRKLSRTAAADEARLLLETVRLSTRCLEKYPSELSGGEKQRVGIARALAAQPDVMICDEITSALDVSVQAAVLELLRDLQATLGLALMFITHDLGVVASIADRVTVLDQGHICEVGPVAQVLATPKHPYTEKLLSSAVTLERQQRAPVEAGSSLGALEPAPE